MSDQRAQKINLTPSPPNCSSALATSTAACAQDYDAPENSADPLTISIIVINWKVRDFLRECLQSLYEQTLLPRERWEVFVVDNNSQDGSVEMVRAEFPQVRLLVNTENLGFGRANNQAFRFCRGKYVLLLNPDTVTVDHTLDRMLEIIETRADVAALGCCLLNTDRSFQRWTGGNPPNLLNIIFHFLFFYRFLPHRLLPPPLYMESELEEDQQVGWVSGACLLLRRAALGEQIFDERFFLYCEDLELCDRLVRAGWKVLYTPRARIIHHEGRSFDAQTPAAQMSKLRSLREVFIMRNGSAKLLLYDLAVSIGLLARFGIYAVAARALPGRGYQIRAARTRSFLGEAMRVLVRRQDERLGR